MSLRDWHAKHGKGARAGDTEFDQYLETFYAEAATHNAAMNGIRSERLFLTNQWIIRAALLAGLAVLPLAYDLQGREKEVQRVEIVKVPSWIKPVREGTRMGSESRPSAGSAPQPAPPPKPVPPPLREIREGHIPKPSPWHR